MAASMRMPLFSLSALLVGSMIGVRRFLIVAQLYCRHRPSGAIIASRIAGAGI